MKSVVYDNKKHYPITKLPKELTELGSIDDKIVEAKKLVSNTASKVDYTDDYIDGIINSNNINVPYVFHNFEFAYDSVLKTTQTAYLAYYNGWSTKVKGLRGSLVTLYLRKDETNPITDNNTLVFSTFIPETTYDNIKYPIEIRWNGEDVSGFFQVKNDGTELYFECNHNYMIRRISVNKRDVISNDSRTFRMVLKGEANRPTLDGLNDTLPDLSKLNTYCHSDWLSLLPQGCYLVKDKPWLAVYGKQVNALTTQYRNESTKTVDLAGLTSKDDSDLTLIYLPTMYQFQYLDSRGRTIDMYTYTKQDRYSEWYTHFLFQNDYVIDYDNPKFSNNKDQDQNPKVDLVDFGLVNTDSSQFTEYDRTSHYDGQRENITPLYTIQTWLNDRWVTRNSGLTYHQVKEKYLERLSNDGLTKLDDTKTITIFDKQIYPTEVHHASIFSQDNVANHLKQNFDGRDYYIYRDVGYRFSNSRKGIKAIYDINVRLGYTKLLRDSHYEYEVVSEGNSGHDGDGVDYFEIRKTKYAQCKFLIDSFTTQLTFSRFEIEESAKNAIKTEIALYHKNPCSVDSTPINHVNSKLYDSLLDELTEYFRTTFNSTSYTSPVLVKVDVTTQS